MRFFILTIAGICAAAFLMFLAGCVTVNLTQQPTGNENEITATVTTEKPTTVNPTTTATIPLK